MKQKIEKFNGKIEYWHFIEFAAIISFCAHEKKMIINLVVNKMNQCKHKLISEKWTLW